LQRGSGAQRNSLTLSPAPTCARSPTNPPPFYTAKINEAIAGNRVVNPVVANSAAGPAAVDRLDRDALGLSGLTHVIWLEGINDIGAGTATDSIIAGYQNVVGRLHAKGIKVYAGTLTSALGISGVDNGRQRVRA
jgi:hypothetical protein